MGIQTFKALGFADICSPSVWIQNEPRPTPKQDANAAEWLCVVAGHVLGCGEWQWHVLVSKQGLINPPQIAGERYRPPRANFRILGFKWTNGIVITLFVNAHPHRETAAAPYITISLSPSSSTHPQVFIPVVMNSADTLFPVVSPHCSHGYRGQSNFKFLQMLPEEFIYDYNQNQYALEVGCRRVSKRASPLTPWQGVVRPSSHRPDGRGSSPQPHPRCSQPLRLL